MIQIWPPELPRPEQSTWQMVPQEARRKSKSDAGPTRYRRRFSAVARMVTLSLLLSRNEKAIFDRFFHEACAEGALLFYMPDPTTDGWALLAADGSPILTETGQPLLMGGQWLCSWGDTLPTEAIVGLEFRKSFSVVVMP